MMVIYFILGMVFMLVSIKFFEWYITYLSEKKEQEKRLNSEDVHDK